MKGYWLKAYGGSLSHYFTELGDIEAGKKSRTACGKTGLVPRVNSDSAFYSRGHCAKCEKALARQMVADAAHKLAQDDQAMRELAEGFLKAS